MLEFKLRETLDLHIFCYGFEYDFNINQMYDLKKKCVCLKCYNASNLCMSVIFSNNQDLMQVCSHASLLEQTCDNKKIQCFYNYS